MLQNYTYKGWCVFLFGKEPRWGNTYEFNILCYFDTKVMELIKQELKVPLKVVEEALGEIAPHEFVKYTISIKKKREFETLNAPYVKEAIEQVNANIDTHLGDVITYIGNHRDKFEQKIISLIK